MLLPLAKLLRELTNKNFWLLMRTRASEAVGWRWPIVVVVGEVVVDDLDCYLEMLEVATCSEVVQIENNPRLHVQVRHKSCTRAIHGDTDALCTDIEASPLLVVLPGKRRNTLGPELA